MFISIPISIFFGKFFIRVEMICTMFTLVVHSINILHGQLVIKPSESIVLRDQFKSFVASCTGQPNTRVGLYYCLFSIEYYISLLQPLGDLHYKSIL